MSAAQSITAWINGVKLGDEAASQKLWNHYFSQLVQGAVGKLAGQRCKNEEAEDAAVSAFKSFCLAAEKGRYPDLNDRESLWLLLITITVSKAKQSIRRKLAKKRGAGRELTAADISPRDGSETVDLMLQVECEEPTPEFIVSAIEQYQRLLALLGDDDAGRKRQQVALLKLQEYTNREIGDQLDCSERTIQRHLQLIRKIWQDEINVIQTELA